MKQLYYIVRREIMVKFKSRSFYLFALVTPILFMLPVIFSIFSGTPNSATIKQRHFVGVISHDFPYDSIDYRNLKFVALNKLDAERVKSGGLIILTSRKCPSERSFATSRETATGKPAIEIE